MLTYGMIADRLSDLVAELEELNSPESGDKARRDGIYAAIHQIDQLRRQYDRLSLGIDAELSPGDLFYCGLCDLVYQAKDIETDGSSAAWCPVDGSDCVTVRPDFADDLEVVDYLA